MASCMHELVFNKTKSLVESAKSISFSNDEVTFDQQSWVSIHAYIVEDWQRIPLLLSLYWVVDGVTFDNFKCILVDAMLFFGDLNQDTIASKLIRFIANGASVFQGVKTCVIVQLKYKNAPFFIIVHSMNHHTNLIVQVIFELGIVWEIEDVLQNLYAYFFHSPKRT